MFFIFKVKHFKVLIFLSLIFILSNCQLKEPIKGHGINFLKNRSDKISLNQSNKNDVINILDECKLSLSLLHNTKDEDDDRRTKKMYFEY